MLKKPMTIEEITDKSDIGLLVSIANSYPKTTEEIERSKQQLSAELDEAGDNRHLYVAFEQDSALAMIQIVLNNADNDPELANGAEIAHLHNLQVKKDLQGQGIGRRMMIFIETKGRELGKSTLTLGVDDVNARAIRLYEKLGYELFKSEPGRIPTEKSLCMKKQI